jgi:flagellar basal-body rod protein FlgB
MLNGLDEFFSTRMLALGLRAQRGEALASNIANADTPNYKARDFDFSKAMQSALQRSAATQGPVGMTRTSPLHLDGGNRGLANVLMQYRTPIQDNIDGNTVDLDTELGHFSDNAIRYQADLTFMSGQIRSLQQAITGQ